jgi:tetratricopeptide (TPR) repeat protein
VAAPAAGATPPAAATAPQPPTASQPPTATPPAQVHVVDTALIAEVEDRAKRAGVAAVDALYDEGIVHHQSGRYREAVQLFAAALQRDPKHIVARNRLAEAQADLERMISTELAEGNRAAAQLRFADAIVAYEKVVVLTYPSDPRNKDAQQRLDQARQRSPR